MEKSATEENSKKHLTILLYTNMTCGQTSADFLSLGYQNNVNVSKVKLLTEFHVRTEHGIPTSVRVI